MDENIELSQKLSGLIKFSILTNGHIFIHTNSEFDENKLADRMTSLVENAIVYEISPETTLEQIRTDNIQSPGYNGNQRKGFNVVILTHFHNASNEIISHIIDLSISPSFHMARSSFRLDTTYLFILIASYEVILPNFSLYKKRFWSIFSVYLQSLKIPDVIPNYLHSSNITLDTIKIADLNQMSKSIVYFICHSDIECYARNICVAINTHYKVVERLSPRSIQQFMTAIKAVAILQNSLFVKPFHISFFISLLKVKEAAMILAHKFLIDVDGEYEMDYKTQTCILIDVLNRIPPPI